MTDDEKKLKHKIISGGVYTMIDGLVVIAEGCVWNKEAGKGMYEYKFQAVEGNSWSIETTYYYNSSPERTTSFSVGLREDSLTGKIKKNGDNLKPIDKKTESTSEIFKLMDKYEPNRSKWRRLDTPWE
jgi:hypothetical protein